VEILTQKSATPSRGWLNIVKTPSARSKIRGYFSKVTRGDDLQEGRDRLSREMRKHGMGISSAQSTRAIKSVAESLGYKEADDMLVNIGTGKESAQHVTNRLLKLLVDQGTEEASKPDIGQSAMSTGKMPPMITSVARPKRHETHSSNGIVVKGLDDVLVRLSRCCNPALGDDIIGFVTRGRGVSVHRRDCPNAADLMREPERIIDVEWERASNVAATYRIETHIEALDRMNLLRDVIAALSEAGVNVLVSSTRTDRDGIVRMRFLFEVSDVSQVEGILARIQDVDGVFEARRMFPGEYVGAGR
jgi:GTP pyrophosphokinase